ncbi:hypothetical protein MRB53_014785 [Persea americana]|uniref:Uncharacterized protein n=1 Tax=Persea americana TaxID=3435 RepID=A0ACC2KCB8_PERAE|nr:hypothetical protein MRB53_014785 [Persea americana]
MKNQRNNLALEVGHYSRIVIKGLWFKTIEEEGNPLAAGDVLSPSSLVGWRNRPIREIEEGSVSLLLVLLEKKTMGFNPSQVRVQVGLIRSVCRAF